LAAIALPSTRMAPVANQQKGRGRPGKCGGQLQIGPAIAVYGGALRHTQIRLVRVEVILRRLLHLGGHAPGLAGVGPGDGAVKGGQLPGQCIDMAGLQSALGQAAVQQGCLGKAPHFYGVFQGGRRLPSEQLSITHILIK